VAGIDSLLRLVIQQGADELRVGVDREPKMFARGAPKRLSMPATSAETLRTLLGELLEPRQEQRLRERGVHETVYDAAALGAFRVKLIATAEGGFEAVFLHGPTHGLALAVDTAEASAIPEPAPAPPAPPPLARPIPSPPPTESARLRSRLPKAPPPAAQPTTADIGCSAQLTSLVARAAALHASDLHLAEREPVCIRVHGKLQPLDADPIDDLASILPLDVDAAARLQRGESLDLVLEIPDTARVRVHVYSAADGLVAALRLLPRAAPSFASLNMPISFEDLVELPHGLVLVCGAAGSGKSTTLAALAQCALNRRSLVLVTLEDPIEYTLIGSSSSLVRRRQIGRDVRDFASGLRDALRADPELLLLGEMRDPETIALALTAAETGHLVLASMHSGSAASAVERIIDAFPPAGRAQIRLQLAESLRAVVVQRLLPRTRGDGRLPAVELLRVTRAVASLIRDGKSAQFATVLQSNRREGMIALERSLADRVQAGDVRLEDASMAANDPDSLATYLMRG
jgi:twitching motility protein PilT